VLTASAKSKPGPPAYPNPQLETKLLPGLWAGSLNLMLALTKA
jgi:hypothetical protein